MCGDFIYSPCKANVLPDRHVTCMYYRHCRWVFGVVVAGGGGSKCFLSSYMISIRPFYSNVSDTFALNIDIITFIILL